MSNSPLSPDETKQTPSTGPHILLVDDEEAFLRLSSAMLRQAGYQSTCVRESAQAKELLRSGNYDLLVADIRMPGNTELELVRELPQLAEGLPVILVTGYPSIETAMASVQLPVISYLPKPFTYEEFITQVRLALERGRLRRTITHLQQRLQVWKQDLEHFADAATVTRSLDASDTTETLQLLTLSNIVGTLQDLQRFSEPSPRSTDPLLSEFTAPLSRREREILHSLLTHHRVSLIARHLQISPHTVRNHLKSIFRKLGVHSQSELLGQLRQQSPAGGVSS